MPAKAPGKSHREGLSLIEVMAMFPTEEAAREWIESIMWPDGRFCPKCGSVKTREAKHRSMPYWCGDCRSYFSVKTETPLANSNIPLQKWAIGIYLCLTSLKSVSSMKLHRDLKISQKAAWFMLHRIREAWAGPDDDRLDGPLEVDETYVGGKRENKSLSKRKELTGRGPVDMTAVVGMKDRETKEVRAEVIQSTDAPTLRGFVRDNAEPGAKLYSDELAAYKGMPEFDHEAVNHSAGEYVRGAAHINGMEAFWSMFKRAHKGTFHKISPKHLQRYVSEFEGKHNIRESDTLAQMRETVARLAGRNLLYRDLIADNGLPSGARS
ncbi:MAG: IS1595 family transposase [Rhodospirillaceae bacterium]|nr:IS1595 family transposase [Rhodospirillaceae bacterium]